MRRMMFCLLLTVCLKPAAPSAVQAADAALHTILVVDTLDEQIGRSTSKDLDMLREEAAAIARNSDLVFELTMISGREFSRDAVVNAVRSVKPGSDDVILFYFVGHGFRTERKNDRWPYLYMQKRQGLDQTWVVDRLREKGARLVLVLSDCCNSVTSTPIDSQVQRSEILRPANFVALFRQASGVLQASASEPGQYAWGSNESGGVFTLQFLRALHAGLAADEVTWNSVMDAATERISVGDRMQKPQYAFLSTAGDDGPKKPAALPPVAGTKLPTGKATPAPTSPRTDRLQVNVTGVSQVVTLKVGRSEGTVGTVNVTGVGGSREIRVRPGQKGAIAVSGTKNLVQIPESLRDSLQISTTGVKNRVTFY